MFKKFKVLSLLLCLCLTLSMFSPVSANSNSAQIDEETMGLLYISGIASKQSYAGEELAAQVTRAGFIGYAAHLTGVEANGQDEYYTDIDGYKEKALINQFARLGYISVDDDRMFEPQRNITETEAVKIVIEMLGYGELARAMGGFPSGYTRLARQIKLWNGSDTAELTLSEMFTLLGNALTLELYEPSAFSLDGTITYGEATGRNVLSVYHDIYSTKGLLRAVGSLSIDDADVGDNEAMIGKIRCEIADGLYYTTEKLIGQWVTAYYHEDRVGSKTLLFICDDSTDCVEIQLKDIQALDADYNLTYYTDDKEETERLDRSVNILYNGEPENENQRELFELFNSTTNGSAKLVDADSNGSYEYCIIKHYIDAYIDAVDNEREIIYNVQDNYTITLTDYESVKLYNPENSAISAADLRGGMVISYAASKNKKIFEGYIASELISGEITSIDVNSNIITYTVNDTEYIVLDEAVADLNIGVGDLASFSINYFGQISHVEMGDANAYKYALLLKSNIESKFKNTLELKYYRQDGQMVISKVAESVTIDGKKYKDASKALLAIPQSTSEAVYPQMVRLCVNTDGEITDIDTAYCSPEHENEEMSLVETPATSYNGSFNVTYINGDYQQVAENLLVVKKTPIFCTPALDDLISGNYSDDDFWLAPQVERDSTAIIYGVTMTMADTYGYRVGQNTVAEGALLIYNRPLAKLWHQGNYLLAVSKTGQKLDAEGNPKTYISGYVYNKAKEYYVADEYVNEYKSLGIEEGDVIIYGFNKRSEITEVRMIYDVSQGGEPYYQEGSGWKTEHAYDNTNAINFECEVYYAANQDSICLKMWKNTNEYKPGICDYIARQTNVIIVDLSREKGNRVSVRPMADVNCADEVGADRAALVLRRLSWNSHKEIVVINF